MKLGRKMLLRPEEKRQDERDWEGEKKGRKIFERKKELRKR